MVFRIHFTEVISQNNLITLPILFFLSFFKVSPIPSMGLVTHDPVTKLHVLPTEQARYPYSLHYYFTFSTALS